MDAGWPEVMPFYKRAIGISLVLVFGLITVIIFMKKSYYPPLPLENYSAKEVVEIFNNANQEVTEIGVEAGTIWFITKNDHDVDGKIQLMMEEKGWVFQEKDGAGLFFERDGERLIVTTEMWSKKYVLVKVPGVDEQR